MVLKLRQGEPTRIQRVKVVRSLKAVRDEFIRNRRRALSDLRHLVVSVLRRVFARLGTRSFRHKPLRGSQVPLVETWNEGLRDISDDLRALYEETGAVSRLQQTVFNYHQVLTEDLAARAAKGASQVIDLRLLAGQLQEDLVIGGDDFNDGTRIDPAFSRDHPAAELVPDQGILTLKRVGSEQVFGEETDVLVSPLTPGVDRKPRIDNEGRFYEGHFFGYVGKARPEGGSFNLEERVPETVQAEGVDYTLLTVIDGQTSRQDWFESNKPGSVDPDYENHFKDLRGTGKETTGGQALRPEDVLVVDLGASEADLLRARAAIVDGNPDTSWECEYVVRVGEGIGISRTYPLAEDIIVGEETDPEPGTFEARFRDEAAFGDFLRSRLVDIFDLEVEVVLRLRQGIQRHANFISLNPLNFGERAWLEVFDVATAETDQSPFLPIEGFDQGLFANTLTDEANEELSEGVHKAVLAPSRYSYRGQGIWTFPTRRVNSVRLKLRQRTPVPSPYQRMHVQLRRTITRSVGTWSVIRDQTKVVKLSYLQTIQAMDDLNFRNEIAGVTTGGSSSGSQTHTTSAKWYYYAFFGLFGGAPKSSSISTSHNDTGWQVTRTWLATYWDFMRYPIGIRDIGVFGYVFSPTSEVVSVPFASPKEILKVQVKVDDFIPAALPAEGRWIRYYVSVDNGQEWLPINPLDHPTVYDDEGAILPYTYTFNAEVAGPQGETNRVVNTREPVRHVRFRAVLSTDESLEDGDRLTPVLKGYRVLMTPRGGLSDGGF